MTIALRTQQVLAHETGVASSVDPLGGSYQVERLTDEMEEAAEAIFHEIESKGGMIAAVEGGYFRRRIAESAFRYQKAVDQGKKTLVGVNAFTNEEAVKIPTLEIHPDIEATQKANLARTHAERDAEAVKQALAAVRNAAAGGANMMPALLEAARRRVTIGEIIDTLATVFGRYAQI